MKVTAQEEYGLRCMVQLAKSHARKAPLTITEIAEAEGLSGPHVGKLLGVLREGGLVLGVRGRSGGYSLSRNPHAITLDEVLSVLSGRLFDGQYCDKYNGELENCVHSENCSLRSIWGAIEMVVGNALKKMTLASLLSTEEGVRESFMSVLKDTLEIRQSEYTVASLPGIESNSQGVSK